MNRRQKKNLPAAPIRAERLDRDARRAARRASRRRCERGKVMSVQPDEGGGSRRKQSPRHQSPHHQGSLPARAALLRGARLWT